MIVHVTHPPCEVQTFLDIDPCQSNHWPPMGHRFTTDGSMMIFRSVFICASSAAKLLSDREIRGTPCTASIMTASGDCRTSLTPVDSPMHWNRKTSAPR